LAAKKNEIWVAGASTVSRNSLSGPVL